MWSDPVFLVLVTLLAVSLLLFALGAFPYPFGLLILSGLTLARVLTRVEPDNQPPKD
jgi:hypothetical protein